MTPARFVAAVLLLAATIVSAAMVAATFASPDFRAADDQSFGIFVVVLALDALVFSATGFLISWRQPGNTIAWVLSVSGLLLVTTFGGFALASLRMQAVGTGDVLGGLFGLMGVASLLPALLLVAMLGLLFPDGRLPSRRWRLPVAIAVVTIVVAEFSLVARPVLDPQLGRNPLGVEQLAMLDPVVPIIDAAAYLALLAVVVLAVIAVAVRFRRARGAAREQHKWFLAATTVTALVTTLTWIFGSQDVSVDDIVATASFSLLPIAIGIAVLRYRLYEIDRLISRTIGWAIVTGLLVTAFVVGLIGLQAILVSLTDSQGETLAVAASTLITLALFQPVRGRVQAAVDRRFDRARYDGERVVEAFAGRLRDQFDLDVLAAEVGRVAAETVRPTMAVVWLRPVGRGGP